MQAIFNGVVIAESQDTVLVEGNHYFPASSLDKQYTTPSATHTLCPWKGTAHYYNISVHGKTSQDACWYYPEPKPKAAQIQDRVAFWKDVKVTA